MDKIKPYLFQLRKHHFWVLSVAVLITGLVGWLMASSALSKVYDTNRKKIDSEFNELRQITQVDNHPNATFKEGVDKKTDVRRQDVLKAWTAVYDEQKNEVLKWPDTLGQEFLQVITALKPSDEIPVHMREIYQNYIKDEFPRLLEIVGARSFRDPEANRTPGAAAAPTDAPATPRRDYKVDWDFGNQQMVSQTLDFVATPTSQEVRDIQEDLWVYRALLTVIANVNRDATGHHNAKIKQIVELGIGAAASREFVTGTSSGRLLRSGSPRAAAPTASAPGGKPGADESRYVDALGKPLPEGTRPSAEFKRMPINLKLVMDQRVISELLAECANSPLAVEVRQLRVNSSRGLERRGVGPQRAGRGPMVTGAEDPSANRSAQASAVDDANPFDVPVEVHGIIYLFNPPDEVHLGNPQVAAGVPPDGAVPVEEGVQP